MKNYPLSSKFNRSFICLSACIAAFLFFMPAVFAQTTPAVTLEQSMRMLQERHMVLEHRKVAAYKQLSDLAATYPSAYSPAFITAAVNRGDAATTAMPLAWPVSGVVVSPAENALDNVGILERLQLANFVSRKLDEIKGEFINMPEPVAGGDGVIREARGSAARYDSLSLPTVGLIDVGDYHEKVYLLGLRLDSLRHLSWPRNATSQYFPSYSSRTENPGTPNSVQVLNGGTDIYPNTEPANKEFQFPGSGAGFTQVICGDRNRIAYMGANVGNAPMGSYEYSLYTDNLVLLMEQTLELTHGIRNEAEIKRKEERMNATLLKVSKKGLVLTPLESACKRLTQTSVKFIRWLRSIFYLELPMALFLPALRRLYQKL